MQAIETKYLPPTSTRPSRIKASCDRGSITLPWPQEFSGTDCHIYAADVLCFKFSKEDAARHNTPIHKSTWALPRVCGGLKSSFAHVFLAVQVARPEVLPCVSRSRFIDQLNDTQRGELTKAGLTIPDTRRDWTVGELVALHTESQSQSALLLAEATLERLAPGGSRATKGTRDVLAAAIMAGRAV